MPEPPPAPRPGTCLGPSRKLCQPSRNLHRPSPQPAPLPPGTCASPSLLPGLEPSRQRSHSQTLLEPCRTFAEPSSTTPAELSGTCPESTRNLPQPYLHRPAPSRNLADAGWVTKEETALGACVAPWLLTSSWWRRISARFVPHLPSPMGGRHPIGPQPSEESLWFDSFLGLSSSQALIHSRLADRPRTHVNWRIGNVTLPTSCLNSSAPCSTRRFHVGCLLLLELDAARVPPAKMQV